MTTPIQVSGLADALRDLNASVNKIAFRNKKGLIKSGLFVQREAQQRVPIDTGNLKASAFTVWGPSEGKTSASFRGKDSSKLHSRHRKLTAKWGSAMPRGNFNPGVTVGFSAFYAWIVHEDVNASHMKTVRVKVGGKKVSQFRQIGEAKYLEKAVRMNKHKILQIIKSEF